MTSSFPSHQNECKNCKYVFSIASTSEEKKTHFCPRCGMLLDPPPLIFLEKKESQAESTDESIAEHSNSGFSLISGHLPTTDGIMFNLGHYQILSSIGRGGMGEVFVAYDTVCGRRIALKRIRADLYNITQLHNRFLKEAHVTSQLTHPAIIPIYDIHREENQLYYTMPYVQGKTLKQILRQARQLKTTSEESSSSIPALVRIFLTVCNAIAYAHSKGVLHRDLKPENIIVGQYGEVMILDWGLAKLINSAHDEVEEIDVETGSGTPKPPPLKTYKRPLHGITRLGKVVGTVAYMAPERALGMPATFLTDIYSLGVILYQILTLQLPFKRGNLKEFRKQAKKEHLQDPAEVAPYREVPRELTRIVNKCLATKIDHRYRSVNELIHELENYIEGRSEWFQVAQLNIARKEDWEFQENVLIAEHVAITRGQEVSNWVSIMISKASFADEIKLEAKVKLGANSSGVGFLLNVPETAERQHINDGYCLWLGSGSNKNTRLLKSNVEVIYQPEVFLEHEKWYHVCIEKYGNSLYIYLNDVLQFSFISHLPLTGTHVGVMSRDADFQMEDFLISVGSLSITVNCLAVPDAFLAHKDYATALNEYRRIGYSFHGRTEGREALFRAGVTLLEQARNASATHRADHLYDLALQEFEKLHNTPGAPLEYLGKALVYQAMDESEEEIKCFELACRRYTQHPLLPVLEEQIVYRMHTCSRNNRKATYSFILLVMRWLPSVAKTQNAKTLFQSVQKHWEKLYFIDQLPVGSSSKEQDFQFCIKLAFWLAKPYTLGEIIEDLLAEKDLSTVLLGNAFFALLELGSYQYIKKLLQQIKEQETYQQREKNLFPIIRECEIAIESHEESVEKALESFFENDKDRSLTFEKKRLLMYLLQNSLLQGKTDPIDKALTKVKEWELDFTSQQQLDIVVIWSALLAKNFNLAGQNLHKYPVELLNEGSSLLHFLYGCWLLANEGQEIAEIHFNALVDVAHPRLLSLITYDKKGKITFKAAQFNNAFLWERRQLLHFLSLYYLCSGLDLEAKKLRIDASNEFIVLEPV